MTEYDHGRAAMGSAVLDRTSDLRFLLIEDSASDRELVRALLSREFPRGSVDVASRLEAALQFLAERTYDLVLADLGLPDAQGDAVVRAVRTASPETALMVLTGRIDTELALLALAEGAQDYLVKGEHDGPHLAEALLHALQRNRTEQMARSHLAAALEMEREAAVRLRELNAAKDAFVRTASHELRTPLASIVAYAELLEDDPDLTEAQGSDVAAIRRNATRLTNLVEELLQMATGDSQRGQLEPAPVDLRKVVSSAADVVTTLSAAKHLSVCYDLPDEPVIVAGDAGQLDRVVINLLSNAVKFTEPGGAIGCRVTSTATDAFVVVTDTGMGIPEVEQTRLFESFFRGAGAQARAIQGTGLGLHIAAAIVDDHGGAVSVDSSEGVGSTFTVRLPLMVDPASHRGEGER